MSAGENLVLVERRDRIGIVTLNDPGTMNALSSALTSALIAALRQLDRDPAIRCTILTGAGKGFCAGGSLVEMNERSGVFAGAPHELRQGFATGIQEVPRLLHTMEMPMVAAVNGAAYGAGLDLAMMCDVRVAAGKATFAESFARIGLVAGDGGAWFLPRLVGLGRALEMTLTGEPIDATTAHAWGLVNRIAEGSVVDAALDVAGKIAAHPREAVRMSRKLLRQSLELSLDNSLGLAAAMQALAVGSEEQREAFASFMEGRRRTS